MSVNDVKNFFKQFNMQHRIIEHEVSTASVLEAAAAFQCEPAQIAKTIALTNKNNEYRLIVVTGDARIDNKKYKDTFGEKAKMIAAEATEEAIGHPVGGVCPFAIPFHIKIYLDISLKRFETVVPACGSTNSGMYITLDELEKYSNYIDWVDVTKF